MKKQAIFLLLCGFALSIDAGEDRIALSTALAPITKKISCLTDTAHSMDAVITTLKNNQYGLDVLMHLPVVDGQQPDISKRAQVYAVKDSQTNELQLAYSREDGDLKKEKKHPVVAAFFADRYIPLVHKIAADRISQLHKYDELVVDAFDYTRESNLDEHGHTVIPGDTHYYNFLHLLVDFNRMHELEELTCEFKPYNLSANAPLYTAFLRAQERSHGFSQDKQDAINAVEQAFAAVPVGTRIGRALCVAAGCTGFLAVLHAYENQEEIFVPNPLELLQNLTTDQ